MTRLMGSDEFSSLGHGATAETEESRDRCTAGSVVGRNFSWSSWQKESAMIAVASA